MSTGPAFYRFESEPNYSAVTFLPTLNDAQLATIDSVGGEVQRRLGEGTSPALLVDLSNLSYIGSAMVAVIVRLWKDVKERNGRMAVVTDHPMVQEVLKIAGLQQIWTIVPTREAGLAALGVKSRPAGTTGDGGGMALTALAVLAVLGGAAALGLYLASWPLLEPRVALWIAIGCAVLGLIVGSVVAAREIGGKRVVGGLAVVGSLAVLGIALVRFSEVIGNDALPPPKVDSGSTPAAG